MRLPSGENATLADASLVAAQRLADRLAGGRVPQPQRVVLGARDDAPAVRREGDARDRSLVAAQAHDLERQAQGMRKCDLRLGDVTRIVSGTARGQYAERHQRAEPGIARLSTKLRAYPAAASAPARVCRIVSASCASAFASRPRGLRWASRLVGLTPANPRPDPP